MTGEGAAARQWACQQLLLRFFHLLDAKRYDEAAGLFQPDGTWLRPDSAVQGRDGVLAVLRERPAERSTCHVVSNLLATSDDDAGVHMTCLLTTYAVDAANAGTPLALVDTVQGLFRANASLRVERAEATFARLEMAPVWTFARK